MSSMGNLEKLGILVIVILVVVVGVVAITPKVQVERALDLAGGIEEQEPPIVRRTATEEEALPVSPDPSADAGHEMPLWLPEDDTALDGPASTPQTVPATLTDPSTLPAVVPAPTPVAPAPTFRLYTIVKGDTLSAIASKELGSSGAAAVKRIVDANPGIDPRRLRIDSKLHIPLDTAVEPAPAAPRLAEARPAPQATPAAPAAAGTYKVQKGDTLTGISAKLFGTVKRWNEIYELNRDKLSSPESLRIDMELRLPGGTTGTTPASRDASAVTSSSDLVSSARADTGAEYVVRKSDTLSGIADRELGSRARWQEILDLNTAVLGGSTHLRPGMKLRLPER